MEDLANIIDDINQTIADVETLQTHNDISLSASRAILVRIDTRRAIGQLKAARASLIKANVVLSDIPFILNPIKEFKL